MGPKFLTSQGNQASGALFATSGGLEKKIDLTGWL
jgi:hypothetical protein